jgi:hypothetical protein
MERSKAQDAPQVRIWKIAGDRDRSRDDFTRSQQTPRHVLHGMGESAATISRAVEHGWVILQGSKPLERKAALTDEGRRLARRGR